MLNFDDRLWDTHNESQIYLAGLILRKMRNSRMTAWPSIETLAKEAKWDERKVKKTLKSLVDIGTIKITEQPGKPNIYSFLIDGFGVFMGVKDVKLNEDNGGSKNVPPAKNGGGEKGANYPPHKLSPELVNESTVNDKDKSLLPEPESFFTLEAESEAQNLPPHSAPPPPPAKKGKSTCTNEPKPILYKTKEGFAKMPKGYTTEFAKIFDQVLSENSKANNLNLPQYNWKAKAGADMKDIKRIAEMVADAMIKKKSKDNNQFENNEITEDEISHGVHFFMQSGFNWLLEIASNKDGKMANFSPSTLARNFNSIIQFAHKPKVQVAQKSKIQAHHDTTLADLDEQRRTRFERHFGEGAKPATSPIDFLGGIRTIKI